MTHYEVLEVATTATPAEIRRAYLDLARRHHPDRDGGDERLMRRANEAWEVLGDPARRAAYDRSVAGHGGDRPGDRSAGSAPRPGDLDGYEDRSDLEDLWADLADDTPLGGTVVLPRWLALLPVGLFAAAVGSGALGAVVGAPGLLGLGVSLFLLSCVLFLAAPFVALAASRRGSRAGR